jgi:hypothetical protein
MKSVLCALALTALGCASDPEEQPAEDPAAHACEQVGQVGTAVTAAQSTDRAPALVISDHPYAVALPNLAAGYVRIDGPLEALLFVQTPDVVTGLFRGTTATDELPAPTPNEDCPDEIPEHFDLDFAETRAWYVQLGPAAVNEVWVMLTEAGGHGGH